MSYDSLFVLSSSAFFFFYDTALSVIYTLSLHDALPIFLAIKFDDLTLSDFEVVNRITFRARQPVAQQVKRVIEVLLYITPRSEEHTSELQSRVDLVCRLLLEKKKKTTHR